MSWIKIASINFLILFGILLLAELGFRVIYTVKSCVFEECDLSKIQSVSSGQAFASKYIGISRFDETLGHVPAEGFNAIIKTRGWNGESVSIDENGFRVNEELLPYDQNTILAVGDSFTFGDQVSDHQTWPSCLQEELGVRVDNAGVFGYGAAQALLRSEILLSQFQYDTVVLSILVGHDFERDRMSYRNGFAKPYVVQSETGVRWSPTSDPMAVGTKYNPRKSRMDFFFRYSALYAYFAPKIAFLPFGNYDRLTVEGENAAKLQDVVDFLVTRLLKLPVKNRVLLLQYYSDLKTEKVQHERRMILSALEGVDQVNLVDTFEVLVAQDPTLVWRNHHTPLGNQIVCRTLVLGAF